MTREFTKITGNLIVKDSGKKFFIDFPKEHIHKLSPKMRTSFGKNSSFQAEDFERIGMEMGINLRSLIEKHRFTGARDLIGRNNAFLFNGSMLGICSAKKEGNDLVLEMYQSDYFTHWVMQSVYQELKKENHPICSLSSIEDISKYALFATSFGYNCFLYNDEEVLFAKRSKNVANMTKSLYHVSINEGSERKDIVGGELDLQRWFKRGAEEELGLEPYFFSKHPAEMEIHSLFLEEDIFQFAVSSSCKLDLPLEQTIHFEGKDKELEIEKLRVVKNEELHDFIREEEFTERSLHVLRFLKNHSLQKALV